MRCLHVVPHIDREASGPSYSVPRLSQSLAAHAEVQLLCSRGHREVTGVTVQAFPQWPIAPRFAISPKLGRALRRNASTVDVIHNHGLWSMANVAAGWSTWHKPAHLVLSPRGTLSKWALEHSKRVKQLLWPFQKRALLSASLVHATSEEEFEDVRRAGYRGPVTIIPNGIDLAEKPAEFSTKGQRRLTFLSRIHPKKGIEMLIDAWSEVQNEFPQWEVTIVGTGDPEYENQLQNRVTAKDAQRFEFTGPIYGHDKVEHLRESQLFVLPTHSENFGVAVAEALAVGVPAIVTHGAPWDGLNRNKCGWWIPVEKNALRDTLTEALSLSHAQLQAMGERGRTWMDEEFSWDSIGTKMFRSYQWLLGQGEQPQWVRRS